MNDIKTISRIHSLIHCSLFAAAVLAAAAATVVAVAATVVMHGACTSSIVSPELEIISARIRRGEKIYESGSFRQPS